MESKNESLQLTRICITTILPVGEKTIFFSKSAPGKISLLIVLVLYTHEIGKTAKKPRVMSFLPWIGCQTVVRVELRIIEKFTKSRARVINCLLRNKAKKVRRVDRRTNALPNRPTDRQTNGHSQL